MSFWQRVGAVTAAIVRMVGSTGNSDWHVAAHTAGRTVRNRPRPEAEPAPGSAGETPDEPAGRPSP